jgi:hypothetical protein
VNVLAPDFGSQMMPSLAAQVLAIPMQGNPGT